MIQNCKICRRKWKHFSSLFLQDMLLFLRELCLLHSSCHRSIRAFSTLQSSFLLPSLVLNLPCLDFHPILLSLCHCYLREWHDLVHHHHWVKPSWAHVLFPPHAILLGPRTMPFHIGHHGGYFQHSRNQLWCLHRPNVLHPWFHINGVLGTPCNGLWSLHCHL